MYEQIIVEIYSPEHLQDQGLSSKVTVDFFSCLRNLENIVLQLMKIHMSTFHIGFGYNPGVKKIGHQIHYFNFSKIIWFISP